MNCPICKSILPEYEKGNLPGHYPFCSERCKLIDLGRWLSGKYAIPVRESEEKPSGRIDTSSDDEIDTN